MLQLTHSYYGCDTVLWVKKQHCWVLAGMGAQISKFDYTAIIYFHGIGMQKRFEEMSRLIDAFDQFSLLYDQNKVGILRDQKLITETATLGKNNSGDDFYSFLQFKRFIRPDPDSKRMRPIPKETFRLYEGYWSDIVAAGLDAKTVLTWLFSKVVVPIRCLQSSWRDHQKLKLSYLFREQNADPHGKFRNSIEADPDGKSRGKNKTAYEQIADAYHLFESWPAQRCYQNGSFKEFLEFLQKGVPEWSMAAETHHDRPSQSQSLLLTGWGNARADEGRLLATLAKKWHRRFVRSQLLLFAKLLSVVVGTVGALTFILFLISDLAVTGLLSLPVGEGLLSALPSTPGLTVGIIASVILVPVYFAAINAIKFFVGDIVFWTAQEGRSALFEKRKEIFERAIKTIDHVCADPSCKRVVIVGHSLGASVGYEALIEVSRRREAVDAGITNEETRDSHTRFRHDKISHFFTLGSPIEIIHYFFDLISSKFHRYKRVASILQRSARKSPFQRGRDRRIKWINITSKADPISHDIGTQSGLRSAWIDDFYAKKQGDIPKRYSKAIEEIDIVGYRLPFPGRAHSSYFETPKSIRRLFKASIMNDEPMEDRLEDPVTEDIARKAHRAVSARNLLANLICWTLAIAALGFWMQLPVLTTLAVCTIGTLSLIMVIYGGWLAWGDYKQPLSLKTQIDKVVHPKQKNNI